MVFNILISNTDDHLRNYRFLYQNLTGWRLSPSYDLNPTSVLIKPRILTTNVNLHDSTASLEPALSVTAELGLALPSAKKIAKEVGTAVSKWRTVARQLKISSPEIERMSSAFEHQDLLQPTSL